MSGEMRALGAMLLFTVVADGHPLIQPVPESVLVVKRDGPDEEMTVVYRDEDRRTRKEVRGYYWNLEYDVGGQLARDRIIEHFVAEKDRLNGVIRRQAGNRLTFTVMREDGGESWCQVWATDGNYTLEIVDEPPPSSEPFDESSRPSATIVFGRNRAELDDDAERALDVIANWLEAHPGVTAEVRGHRGPLEDPLLVEQRATAVVTAIMYRGISEERLTVTSDDSNQGFEVTVVASELP